MSTLLLIGSMAGCGKADLNDSTDQSSVAGEMSDHQEETDAPDEQSEEDNSSLGGMEGIVLGYATFLQSMWRKPHFF